jgi:hypothetical protein
MNSWNKLMQMIAFNTGDKYRVFSILNALNSQSITLIALMKSLKDVSSIHQQIDSATKKCSSKISMFDV